MKRNKPVKVLIYIDNGVVWPVVKVCNHDEIEVIVVNNDQHVVWKPVVQEDCDKEIASMSDLADRLKTDISEMMTRRK